MLVFDHIDQQSNQTLDHQQSHHKRISIVQVLAEQHVHTPILAIESTKFKDKFINFDGKPFKRMNRIPNNIKKLHSAFEFKVK